ncbi:hypothetical protein [Parvicella tangerina]|uniref:Carboxypeptidase regulatory-like domain-containing protein n=1 Tax=Parvicella tangerina TaxID=2829795 RepID=A0A916JKP3_9FLAO|nr:hypothetical protein [Parvicella tangerina]CAG5077956.1 hypothetical protein CRYO30217_00525 [Parvicella tangerina]
MRKCIMLIIVLASAGQLLAKSHLPRMKNPVEVISDQFDGNVPQGKCLITGEVWYQGEKQQEAEVCSYRGKSCVKTDKKGQFTVLVDTNETYVYATVIGAETIYLTNHEFKSQHHVVLKFSIPDLIPEAVKKPVIYLYADQEVSMELKLLTSVELTFTYPVYEDGWQVNVSPEQGISVDGTNYPYLFWEGESYGELSYLSKSGKLDGEIIQTDTVINYLERQLSSYGLNETESTDFITFWGPVLSQKKFAFVHFVIDEAYEQIASIESSTEIQHERRIFLMFDSFDERPKLEISNSQPEASQLNRSGLTLIEWGGARVAIPWL